MTGQLEGERLEEVPGKPGCRKGQAVPALLHDLLADLGATLDAIVLAVQLEVHGDLFVQSHHPCHTFAFSRGKADA